MMAFVRGDLQGKGPQAVDVLRSGLSLQPDPTVGADSCRLLLALSEAAAAQDSWRDAAAQAEAALRAAAGAGPTGEGRDELSQCAALLQARALLVRGSDAEAASVLGALQLPLEEPIAAPSGSAAHALGLRLAVQHALGEQAAAADTASRLAALLPLLAAQHEAGSGAPLHGVLDAFAQKALGDAALATGVLGDAEERYSSAAGLAAAARPAPGDAAAAAAAPLSAAAGQEVRADALLGVAQARLAARCWAEAEEPLGEALTAAEASHGQSAPLLAAPLLLLGVCYSRSARVMYAEGLFREAAKLLRLDPGRPQSLSDCVQHVHPSLAACLAWRYGQLLAALPNRVGEAAAWAGAARQLWPQRGGGSNEGCGGGIEAVLGDNVAFTGQGQQGTGAIVSLTLRRLTPVWQVPPQQPAGV